MSWNGIGFTMGQIQPITSLTQRALPLPALTPASAWNGAAGSGYASIPADPVRTTAKPALRLITPPFQWFTDAIEIGVMAAANESGTLFNTLGIEAVTFYFEGHSVTVDAPRWHTITTTRGPRTYFGWWVRLRKPAGRAGHGHLYAEATARDATMQKRVIGPFTYSPQTTMHDAELTIAPSQTPITGARYASLTTAIAWCKANAKANPLLTITEPGIYNFGTSTGELYTNPGYINVTANVPGVVIGRTQAATGASNMLNDRSKLHLFGANLTLDFSNCLVLEQAAAAPSSVAHLSHWLDGVTMTSGEPPGANSDWAGSGVPRSVLTPRMITGQPWLTEIEVEGLHNSMIGAQLIRGCNAEHLGADIANSTACILQSRFFGNDNSFWNDDRPAFDIHYTGPETSATLARTGNVLGSNGGIWNCTIGGVTYSFNTGRQAYFTGADGRYFADLVACLNTLPDITATLRIAPFDRVASSGSLPGFAGQGFAATDIKTAPLTIVSNCDIHPDFYQHPGGSELENTIIAYNQVLACKGQILFLSPPTPEPRSERDVLIFGNIFHQGSAPGAPLVGGSQWGRPNLPLPASHVVIAHNTFVDQQLLIRNEGGGLVADNYCLIRNNTMPALVVLGTSPAPNLTLDGMHLHTGGVVPAGAINTSVGGDQSDLFVDAQGFDFTPSGTLLTNLKPAAMPFDLTRAAFSASAPAGAIA